MKCPFIELINVSGQKVSINVTKIASVEKQKITKSDEYCTYIVIDGGGGAYVATHHFRRQYEDVMMIIKNWYRGG